MGNNEINKILVNKNSSIKETMRVIDRGGLGTAFIVDKNKKIFGVVTDGDIRGAILKGVDINDSIAVIANKNPVVIKKNYTESDFSKLKNSEYIKNKIPIRSSLKIPVLDENGKIKDIIFLYADGKKFFRPAEKELKIIKGNIKKILITGGAGYLGSILCRKLIKKGYKVIVLDNLTYGDEGIKDLYKNANFKFLKGDVRNITDVMNAIEGVDAAIHLAAIVGDPACQKNSRKTIEINYLATKSFAEACKFNQVNKFLFASTCSVYGASEKPDNKLKEDSSLNPVSLYAETKLESEKGILSLADENFSPTIFRFATLCGVSPRMRFDLVVNLLTAKALIDKEIQIFGGNQWRPSLEVSDAAEACLKWLELPIEKTREQIFNVGGDSQNYKIIQIGKIIKELIPEVRVEINRQDTDERNYRVSFDKASTLLNFKPQKTIEKSILEIINMIRSEEIKSFNEAKYNNYKF
jgi:nucleoside-diphosphate-sugar epimerase